MTEKTMIELFSGSKIMSDTFKERGYKVFTVDNNKELNPDLCKDILELQFNDIPQEFREPAVIWASPPCTTFSVSSFGKYWENRKPKTYKTYIGLALALKTVEIIKALKPIYYFIENPVGMLRKQHFMEKLHRITVTYCQYGESYMKPTDIWTNSLFIGKRCRNGYSCHDRQPRNYRTTKEFNLLEKGLSGQHKDPFDRAKLPKLLCIDIVKFCEDNADLKQKVLIDENYIGPG